ncbi:gliding motility-associated C-terminal domain-containing protein [Leadbetterella sp. DM7]|uniref:T9SS type B sorting domain-containing protein n=1 Tax=Leadbetterella sp. DM7 TaxID=3235085 RepID=UPI00349E639D
MGLLFFGATVSNAQLYVGKACLVDPSAPVTPPATGSPAASTPTSCDEKTYFFEATENNFGNWTWDFGDGTVLTGTTRNPLHAYTTPGPYTVKVTPVDNGGATLAGPYTRLINVGYYPYQPLFRDKTEQDSTICKGKTITLDPYKGQSAPANVSYKWFPEGQTTRTIDVSEAGCYSVEVIDNTTGCSRSAKINVKLCYEESSSGGGSEKWYFGHGSGLEFTLTGNEMVQDSLDEDGSLDPQPEIVNPSFDPSDPGVNKMQADEAAAMVFDQHNKLVLYTDGKKLYSGDDDSEIPVAGGGSFAISKATGAQGVALIPKPVCSACDFINYYLFTVDENTGLLTYSVIDMRERGGKGAVVEADVPVAVNVKGKITAERGSDDEHESYFITAYNALSGSFQSITVDALGTVSVEQTMPPLQPGTVSEGYVAVSADGNQLAHGLVINGNNFVQITGRNPENNTLSAPRLVDLGYAAPPTVYGLAFSPNGAYLYVTLKGDGSTVESRLLQVDIANGGVTEIASSMQEFGALGLGPKYGAGSKYVYVTINNSSTIHYLQAPDEAGRDAVGFTLNSSNPGTAVAGTTKLGFPNVVAAAPAQDGQGLGANYSGNCMNAPTLFTSQEICSPMKNDVDWVIDGETFKNNPNPSKTFTSPGWKTVKMTVRPYKEIASVSVVKIKDYCGSPIEFEGRVYIKPAPELTIPDPLYVCDEYPYQGLTVDPKPTGGSSFEFEWLTRYDAPIDNNYRNPVFTFQTAQTFKVKVTNNFNCTTERQLDLQEGCEPIVNVPTAFTPNGDGLNETFKVVHYFIQQPRLEIYNRWGEQVFQTDDLDNRWDGRYKGQVLSNQLFAYVLRYYMRDFPQLGEQKKVGSILVLTEK